MRHRGWARVARVAVVGAVVLALVGCGGEPDRRGGSPAALQDKLPDILIVTVDTLRADHLSAYGYTANETPAIDALLARGVTFTNATTPMPRTTPALATVLTGLPPHRHGSREVNQPVGDVLFLSEILKRHGYATLAVSGNLAASPRFGLDQGFDRFDTLTRPDNGADNITAHALAGVAEMPADAPKLVWVHYMDPHADYAPPAPWGDVPDREKCDALLPLSSSEGWAPGLIFTNRNGVAADALAACTALYDGEISTVDASLARLLQGLREHLRLDDAIVVFAADHGENLGEEGLFYEHGPSLNDASLRVPLGISAPGVAPRVDPEVATLEDVAPTVLGLAGVPGDEWKEMEGRNLAPALRGARDSRKSDKDAGEGGERIAFAESGSALEVHSYIWLESGRADHLHCLNVERFSICGLPGETPGLFDNVADPMLTQDVRGEHQRTYRRMLGMWKRWPAEAARQHCARVPGWKLVAKPKPEGGFSFALYDLARDPAEEHDVSADHPGRSHRLRQALQRWMRSLPPIEMRQRSPEEVQSLRSLGYIG